MCVFVLSFLIEWIFSYNFYSKWEKAICVIFSFRVHSTTNNIIKYIYIDIDISIHTHALSFSHIHSRTRDAAESARVANKSDRASIKSSFAANNSTIVCSVDHFYFYFARQTSNCVSRMLLPLIDARAFQHSWRCKVSFSLTTGWEREKRNGWRNFTVRYLPCHTVCVYKCDSIEMVLLLQLHS